MVGIASLRDDHEVMNWSITLFKLRYLVVEVLLLTPFMPAIERLLVQEIAIMNRKNEEKMTQGGSPVLR